MEEKLTEQLDDLLWGEATGEGLLSFLLGLLSFLEEREGVFYMDPSLYETKEDFSRMANTFVKLLGVNDPAAAQLRLQVLDVITSVMLPQTYQDQQAADQLRRLQDWLTLQDMYARRDTAAFEAAMTRYFSGALENLARLSAQRPAAPVGDPARAEELEAQLLDARERIAELEADRARLRKRIETFYMYQ